MSPESYIWTPQDLGRLAELNLPKSGYRAYSVAVRHADKRSGVFTITKATAAAAMRCKSRRTADTGFALLVEHGVLAREENIRSGRQRANTYRLRSSKVWKQCAIFARAAYEAIMAKMRERQAAKAARLEALQSMGAAEICGGVPQAEFKPFLKPSAIERLTAERFVPSGDRSRLLETSLMRRAAARMVGTERRQPSEEIE